MGAHGLSENLAAGLLFFTSSLVASLLLYLWSRPGRTEALSTAAVAVAASVILGLPGPLYAKPMVFAAYWAVIAFAFLFASALFSKTQSPRLPVLIAMIVPPVLTLGTLPVLRVVAMFTPSVWDYYLYAFDGSYGFQPGFLAGQFVQGTAWVRLVCEACYVNLPAALAVMYCLRRHTDPSGAQRFFLTVVFLAAAGCAGYLLFPAVGSVVAFGERFPDSPPLLAEVPVIQIRDWSDPRNCIPSLHTAWALILWLYAWRGSGSNARRALFTAYVWLTLLYTLSCGHYLVDMVVAVPFTALIHIATDTRRRAFIQPMAAMLATVGGWLLFLRFGGAIYSVSPAVPWLLTFATIAATCLALRACRQDARTSDALPSDHRSANEATATAGAA